VNSAIQISRLILDQVLDCARKEWRQECCGLLAGREGVITRIFPASNAAGDTARNYAIAPEELFVLMRTMRSEGLDLMGIYHSHPNGKNEPSPRDVERAYYPEAAYFIVSAATNSAGGVRAFSIREGQVSELKIEIE
jgi:proteasome lid subunit RPN8/RPN11